MAGLWQLAPSLVSRPQHGPFGKQCVQWLPVVRPAHWMVVAALPLCPVSFGRRADAQPSVRRWWPEQPEQQPQR